VLPPWRVDVGVVSLEVTEVVVTGSGVEEDADEGRNEEDSYALVRSGVRAVRFERWDRTSRLGGASVRRSRSQKTLDSYPASSSVSLAAYAKVIQVVLFLLPAHTSPHQLKPR
jgi:hypothetical protein